MADNLNFGSLLSTKLHRPAIDNNHVHRPRLLARLEQNSQRPFTLVSAPAGYGKSVLISCWFESCKDPAVWLSLDEKDNDLRTFASYVILALQSIFPKVCQKTHALLNAIELPSIEVLSTSLLNELNRIEQSLILVLDDYHLIKETAVHSLLTAILKHPPPSLHLVIISRKDPPLPITSLRACSQVTEVRTQDLRFTVAETELFLKQTLGIQVKPSIAAVVEEKTEGWVTGLRLASLSMRGRRDLDPRLLEPHVDAQFVMEYLFTEVFSKLSTDIIQYLMVTSILDRFCGPLCEAVCVPGFGQFTCEMGGWEFINWLKKENLFLIPLDAENRWFRFHHLFKKLLFNQLKRRCSAEEIKELHSQASVWFAQNNLIEEALQHALAAGDIQAAAQLVAQFGYQLMNDQQWVRLTHWLSLLPRDHVEQNLELLLLEAWLHHVQHDISGQLACLEKIEDIEAHSAPNTLVKAKHITGQIEALRGFKHYITADGKSALTLLRRACEDIPLEYLRIRLFANIFQLGAYQMIGDLDEGLPVYQKEMREVASRDMRYHSQYLTNLCFIYWIDADLTAMRQTAEGALFSAKDEQLPDTFPYVRYFEGIFHFHRNELEIAEEKLTQVAEVGHAVSPMNYAHSVFALSLTLQAQGKTAMARKMSETVISHALESNNADLLRIAHCFEAELALRQGRLAKAFRLAKTLHTIPLQPTYRFYLPQLSLIQILLAEATIDSRRHAADLLEQSLTFFRSIHNIRFQIDLLALQALLYHSQGDEQAALKMLTEALALAEPGGFIRLFVDLGPQMADLLKKLAKQNVAYDYIGKILAAFREDEHRVIQAESDYPTAQSPPLGAQPLVDLLTNRELDVLELLARRLQNKEIAAKLFISPETVKKHLNNIYGKLNVSNRQQAVHKAEMLDIIS